MCYRTRRECVPTLALRVVTEHFPLTKWEIAIYTRGSCDLNAWDAANCGALAVNGTSPRVFKFSWHCHLIWPGVNLPWTGLHYAKSVAEVSGKQVASTFSHSWSERWLLDTKLDSPHSLEGISSQATLLVSANKPQILLKCLHVWVGIMQWIFIFSDWA